MEELYQKLDEILKYFTTETTTCLPQQIGKFTCIPLMNAEMDHAGYLVVKGQQMHFFPADSFKINVSGEKATNQEIQMDKLWSAICFN